MNLSVLITAALLQASAAPPSDSLPTWRIDPAHSEVAFRVRHLMSRVRGTFRRYEGTLHGAPPDWSQGSVSVAIEAGSIFTDNERRDNDLRSDNFFDVSNFPQLTFESTGVERDGDGWKVYGALTIRGTTRPVTLEVSYLGATPDGARVGFEASTIIDRTDYGVSWNRAVEGGGLLLGDDVEIMISIEAVRI